MNKREEFVKELRSLCDKHGLYIVHWSGLTMLAPIGHKGEDVLADFESLIEEMLADE